MRLLFSTCSPGAYMAPPPLADRQVVCGPDWPDAKSPDGRVVSLRTPVGEYDLAAVVAKLPPEQRPDVVACLVDASWRNLPRGVAKLKCPVVLLVADTHHLRQPLVGMLRYATSEPFARVVLLYDKHHACVFRSAGIRQLFWFPGLTLPFDDAAVRAARSVKREPRVAFVGQAGAYHPRRLRLIEALAKAGLRLESAPLGQAAGLARYGSSLAGFNASLNGDLNLRVFEILASGAALLTDRLAPAAGLEKLLRPEGEFLAYGSEGELIERVRGILARPAETAAVGAAGAAWFDRHMNLAARRAAFAKLALEGAAPEPFALETEPAPGLVFPGDPARLVRAVALYETLQQMHRVREHVAVGLRPGVPDDVARLCATLPRLECRRGEDNDVDLLVLAPGDELPAGARPPRLWIWDAPAGGPPPAVSADYLCHDARVGVYRRRQAAPRAGDRPYVLMVTDDPESGGVAQYNHTILLALAASGHRVACLQSFSANPLIRAQREAGVSHHWIDYHTGKDFARTLTDPCGLDELLCEDRPDLVVFSNCCPLSSLAAREIARLHNVPYVCVEGFVGAYLADRFAPYLPALARQYAGARAIVAVSGENRDLLVTRFGAPSASCEVVHYGRPDAFFAQVDPARRARLRAQLRLPADAIVSFTAARLAAVKGYDRQLAAFARLKGTPAGRRLHLVWAGEGDQRAALETEAGRLGLAAQIHFLGHRWDVADWYDAADFFTLSSHLEGMPLAIMEAMAKGLPVVASAVSGIPEELDDTGRLLPDPVSQPEPAAAELARVWTEWTLDESLRRELGRRARERADALFRESRMIGRTLALLRAHLSPASVSS